jgi:hypothetical protein
MGRLPAAYAKRYLRTLRHGVKLALGMPPRSGLKPTGGQMSGYSQKKISSILSYDQVHHFFV